MSSPVSEVRVNMGDTEAIMGYCTDCEGCLGSVKRDKLRKQKRNSRNCIFAECILFVLKEEKIFN